MGFTSGNFQRNGEGGSVAMGRTQKRLRKAYNRLGSWRRVAAELGINHGYVMHGIEPVNREVRRILKLPVRKSEGRTVGSGERVVIGVTPGWEEKFFKRVRRGRPRR